MPALAAEMAALEEVLKDEFSLTNVFLRSAADRLFESGGKRLRPALLIASSMTGEYDREKTLPVAAAIEILHTATLVHDDVIDLADTRRGVATLAALHGNHVAILTGDYLLSKTLVMLAKSNLPDKHKLEAAYAVESMCKGEVAQYIDKGVIPSPRAYIKRIIQKTGILFSAACSMGAFLGGHDEADVRKFGRFGLRLGTAFQIRDDLMDLSSGAKAAGKPVGHDLKNGIITLPVLLAARDDSFKSRLVKYLASSRSSQNTRKLIDAAVSSGGYAEARNILDGHIQKCRLMLEHFGDSAGRPVLAGIIDMIARQPEEG